MATMQFPSTTQFRRKKKVAIFPGTEDVHLDRFQRSLLDMITSASDIALGKFFKKNHGPLYQFLLRLYIISLTNAHPDRGRINSKNNSINCEKLYTTKEHQIISEWANLLTDDEPINYNQNITETFLPETSLPQLPENTNIIKDDLKFDILIPNKNTTILNTAINTPNSPVIQNSKTSNPQTISATIDVASRGFHRNRKKAKQKKHKDRNENVSLQNFAELATAIAMMKNQRNFDSNYDMNELNDIKEEYDNQYGVLVSRPTSPRSLRRDSIWSGVLDTNNITMAPANIPRWRSRSNVQEVQLCEDGLLDCIVSTLSTKNVSVLIKEINNTSEAMISLFLPFICVLSSTLDDDKDKKELQTVILNRVVNDDDIKQNFQFFLNSYKDVPMLLKSFKQINVSLMKRRKSINENDKDRNNRSKPKPPPRNITDVIDTDDMKIISPESHIKTTNKMQIIEQQTPESAISLFLSVFKYNLSAGSQIKLCLDSRIRDPINNGAPYLSRIEVRDVMQTKSKPYFCDLYVSNKNDNHFEYLSSTVLLKKGDDLRRDIAVLQCFRLMNKIWREKGLSFSNCSVSAMTYKCVSLSPNSGIIEVIEGCKPLRLVSILEDTITIKQQFNLVASAVGSYIGAFVMGVRDRHFDNVLIQTSDCTLFHIDFGFILGETASVDTSKFAITNDLKKLMDSYWDKFIELGVQAYLTLRDKHEILIKYAQIAFQYLNKSNEIESFIKNQLHINDMSHDKAAKYIARKLKESPNSAKTKFKNAVHKLAKIMD